MPQNTHISPPLHTRQSDCITLIGMAGCGKSTVGKALALHIGWAHLDTDHLIEAHYGTRLQHVADAMDKEAFLDVESAVCQQVNVRRTVISTGGSVVYRASTMEHFHSLGPVVYLRVELPLILERISQNPDRGLAIAPGQTVEDLYNERIALYETFAHHVVDCTEAPVSRCVEHIVHCLAEKS